jgi:hypothetical protein
MRRFNRRAYFSTKVADHQRNVLTALAQRRNGQGKDVQAVVQIAAKRSPLNHLLQV